MIDGVFDALRYEILLQYVLWKERLSITEYK